jgi:tetratricopeptide (TPR) repeat protein
LFSEKFFENALKVCKDAAYLGRPYAPPYIPLIEHNIPFQKDVLARIYHHTGHIDKAILEYERLIHFGRSRKERWLIHPVYYYRLALLYEQQGKNDRARTNYRRFLDLWKDADPGFSEVEDARQRLLN